MKIPDFLKRDMAACDRDSFEKELFTDNILRGKILAVVVIGFDSVLFLTNIVTSLLRVDSRFAFNAYLVMYALMIAVNAAYFLVIKLYGKNPISVGRRKKLEAGMIVYITFIMSWGSIVSLMDQKLYGQLMTFMVNMIVCSVIYLLGSRIILIPYVTSVLILGLGLPLFQKSGDILVGHYVNLFIFIFISWLTSRILYQNYCDNFAGRKRLDEYNRLLENEVNENKKINSKLAAVNKQLQELALLDELTGIPNRRSFREFIDRAFQLYVKDGSTLSMIMIDIDFFKQFNDCYGHEEGDKTLIAVANKVNDIIEESSEFVVRWGGEEFIFAAFNKSREEIANTANAIRAKVSELNIAHEESRIGPDVTVSMGSCTIPVSEKRDVRKAIKLADRALYTAKSSGRNRIIAAGDESDV